MIFYTANQIRVSTSTPKKGSSLPAWMMLCNRKRLKVSPPNTGGSILEGGGLRRWDEMPPDVLVQIFNRLPFGDFCNLNTFVRVCRSWFLSALDVVFPSTTILDLRVMCDMDEEQTRMYKIYLKLALDTRPITQWTTFYHPHHTFFDSEIIIFIAKRTPWLKCLIVSEIGTGQFLIYLQEMRYWSKLEELHINHFYQKHSIPYLAWYFKNLRCLSLSGNFDVEDVSDIIRYFCPQLEYLSLQWSLFTVESASLLIAEAGGGNNNRGIETLDLQHCLFFEKKIDNEYLAEKQTVDMKIHEKAAATVKNYLCCEGMELCPECRSSVSYRASFPQIYVAIDQKYLHLRGN